MKLVQRFWRVMEENPQRGRGRDWADWELQGQRAEDEFRRLWKEKARAEAKNRVFRSKYNTRSSFFFTITKLPTLSSLKK